MATDQTQNHQLYLYNIGEENWTHTPDMDTIDERLPIAFDERANRSNYTAHQGAIFWAQDTGEFFRGDGASWQDAEADFVEIRESGVRVATRDYVDTEIANVDLGDVNYAPEVHDNSNHDPNFATVTQLNGHANAVEGVHGAGTSGVASNSDVDDSISTHATRTDVHGLPGGNLANETYVDDEVTTQINLHSNVSDAHHAKFTNSEAMAAVDGSDVSVREAEFWDGYELVIDDETPTTNQYIRLETN